MNRVVLDTNIIVSSLLSPAGPPARIIDAWRDRRFLLVVSPTIIAEVAHTLGYARIRRKYGITDEDVCDVVDLLEHEALVVPGGSEVQGAVPDDPDDEIILTCALDGRSDVIVSGDPHLLGLGAVRGIPIVTARTFLDELAD